MIELSKNVTSKIIVCPKCNGKGYEYVFNGDSDSARTCETCDGNRVVTEVTAIIYEKVI
jgi:DnaJ-class molecular chaperone